MSCRSLARLTRALALVVVAHGFHPSVLRAETPLSATCFASTRSTHSIAPFEHVDPFSGNLLLTFTDLVLPGNAGLNLVVQRTYNSKIHPHYEDHNGLKLRTWVGMGWSLHFGRVVQSQSTTPGETVIEMPDGSGHALYNALAPPHPAFDPADPGIPHGSWVTSGVWRYNRTTHTLRMTNGLVYEFGHIGIPNGPEGVVRYVTEIRDPYDNRLTFEYFGAAEGPTDGVKRIVQHLGGGQQREVTFAVTPMAGGYALASMTYTPQGGTARTWTYTHAPAAAPFNTATIVLGATSSPVPGTTWTFGYRTDPTGPGPELLTVTGPLGGQLAYTYTNVYRPVETETVVMRHNDARPSLI